MTETPSNLHDPSPQSDETTENPEDLLRLLRRKEGNWVGWGQTCAKLQKLGYNTQAIFEASGFEPIQQNQIIVAAQVYSSMLNVGVSEEVRSHYGRIGSDSLYELRILNQEQRASTAEFLHSRNLNSEAAKEVAKAVKDYSRFSQLPQGFTNHPGDAVAYSYWRLAKQQSDLQERSRLIARGLMFAHSQTARQQIEQLLTEFTITPQRPAPSLPIYRLEAEESLPRLIPLAGKLPITLADFQQAKQLQPQGAFQTVQTSANSAWVSLPGWQLVLKTGDPVAILCDNNQLPNQATAKSQETLLLIDRREQEWDVNSYFIVEQSGQLQIKWFPENPNLPLLGRLILILRPKNILDEDTNKDIWQIDE